MSQKDVPYECHIYIVCTWQYVFMQPGSYLGDLYKEKNLKTCSAIW